MPPSSAPHPVDVHVGARLRVARRSLGLTQAALGQAIGVSVQQIQKYETGANRLSASALFRLCGFLGRPVLWFYDGLEATGRDPGPGPDLTAALMASDEGVQMAMAMAQLSPAVRRKVLALVRAVLPDETNTGARL